MKGLHLTVVVFAKNCMFALAAPAGPQGGDAAPLWKRHRKECTEQ